MGKRYFMSIEKNSLHPRNLHRSRYDFPELIQTSPELEKYVSENPYGDLSINFSDPEAVKMLNKSLLMHFYGLQEWDIPVNYLCPPIPGRADYIHYLADLLAALNGGEVPRGKQIKILDIGTGANCIYPIIGHQVYGWSFTGTDIDKKAIHSAENIAALNPVLQHDLNFRLQHYPSAIFKGIFKPGELFDLTLCNPPFHASAEEALAGSKRKVQNLSKGKKTVPVLNFGGQQSELWCKGGELEFVRNMITESKEYANQCCMFSSLVSKSANLPPLYAALERAGATRVETVSMSQGQKQSRFIAWTFLNDPELEDWRVKRLTKKS